MLTIFALISYKSCYHFSSKSLYFVNTKKKHNLNDSKNF